MIKYLARVFGVILLTASGYAVGAPLPENIVKQLPKGYSVLAYRSGELDDDKLTDFLVVVGRSNEKSAAPTEGAPARPLMLFIQNKDGCYSLARRNDHVVLRIDEGGQCDPFEDGADGLAINKHYFTVEHSVSCGQHWTDYITFHYVPALRNWVFHNRISESWVMNDGTDPDADALVSTGKQVVTGKGKLTVLFEDYRASDR